MKKIFSILFCAILFCSFIITPCLAASYPSVDDYIKSDRPHYGYFVFERQGVTYLGEFSTVSEDANYKRIWIFGFNRIRVQYWTDDTLTTYPTLSYTLYKLEDGDWVRVTGETNVNQADFSFNPSEDTVLYGTHDIYTTVDLNELFFQAPPEGMTLSEAIQLVVEKEIPATQGIITEQMMIIVLCGVGCLALLISLVLLVRTLRRYLPL